MTASLETVEKITHDRRRGSDIHTRLRAGASDMLREAEMRGTSAVGGRGKFSLAVLERPDSAALIVGSKMDQTVALLTAVTDEVRAARSEMNAVRKEMMDLAETVVPEMADLVQKLRSTRMVVVSEMASSLSAMRDVRKFFLEDDHATEVARLERFVLLCKEMLALKNAGVIDAVCDSALNLAVGRETKGINA